MQANTIRVSFWLRAVGDTDESNPWIVTWFLKPISAPMSNADFDTDFGGATPLGLNAIWWDSIGNSTTSIYGLRAVLPSGIEWYYTETSARLAMTPGDADRVATFQPSTPRAGVLTGTVATQPLCLVLQKRTSTGSRRQWGRNYIPCRTAALQADGRVNQADMTVPLANLLPITQPAWVASAIFTHVVHNSDGFSRSINAFSLGTYVGVQRRRLR